MISEEEFRKLKPGDMVQIVSTWPADKTAYQNPDGHMDIWLGATMTVRKRYNAHLKLEEDNGLWNWFMGAIEKIADEHPIHLDIQYDELL